MTRTKTLDVRLKASALAITAAAVIAVLLAAGTPALADTEGSYLDGSFRLGYRFVDVNGTETKYKEDINLEEGVRLFEIDVNWRPAKGENAAADRISLDVDNFGGDPFESLHFAAQKFGKYDFRYDRTKSTYFYQDIILPVELTDDPRLALAGDFHHFDFDRVRDSAQLNVRINPRAKFLLGFERFTRDGESTTVLDLQRDEFEFDAPVHESYNDISAGFEYSWDKATLVLEQRYREFENDQERFLPGGSPGENTGNASELYNYVYDTPYDYTSNSTTVRLNARPGDDWLVRASAMVQSLDLDLTALEEGSGTGANGQPFAISDTGRGEISRDTDLFNLDISYLVNDRVAIIGGVRQYNFDQIGDSELGGDTFEGEWDVETTSVEAGVETTLTQGVTLAVGVLTESRDATHEGETETTDHDGVFARFGWSPNDVFRLQASYEDSSYDDPFTVTSPTDRERLKITAKIDPNGTAGKGFWASANALFTTFDNSDSGWEANRDQIGVRLGYRQDRVDFQAGYQNIDMDREINPIVLGSLFPLFYDGDSDFFDARVRFSATDRFRLGADARFYDNSGTFGIERDDLRGYFEFDVCENYLVNLAYRTVDYNEKDFNFDDYDADIIEVSVGYRF